MTYFTESDGILLVKYCFPINPVVALRSWKIRLGAKLTCSWYYYFAIHAGCMGLHGIGVVMLMRLFLFWAKNLWRYWTLFINLVAKELIYTYMYIVLVLSMLQWNNDKSDIHVNCVHILYIIVPLLYRADCIEWSYVQEQRQVLSIRRGGIW